MDIRLLQGSYTNEEGSMTSLYDDCVTGINFETVMKKIKSLCVQLSVLGHEYILVTASHTSTVEDRQLGSAFGLKFLYDHKDLFEEFRRYSKGLTSVKIDVAFEDLSCQEHCSQPARKRKRTAKDAGIGDLSSRSFISSGVGLDNLQRNDGARMVEKNNNGNLNVSLKDMIDGAVDRLENDIRQNKQATSVDQSDPGSMICRETTKSERFLPSDDSERMTPPKFCLSNLRLSMPKVELRDIFQNNHELNSNLITDSEGLSSSQNRLIDGEFSNKMQKTALSNVQSTCRFDAESDNGDENVDDDMDDDVDDNYDDDPLDDNDDDYRPNDNERTKRMANSTMQTSKSFEEKSEYVDKEVEGSKAMDHSQMEIQFVENGDQYECMHCHKLYTRQGMHKHKSYLMQRRSKGKVLRQKKLSNSSSGMEYEVIQDQDGSEKYKCLHCQFIYSSKSNLNRHHEKVKRKTLSKELENSTYCDEEFTSITKLDAHKCKTEAEILQKEKSLVSSSSLEYEVIHDQDGSERYKCRHCQFVYSSKWSLYRHHRKVKRKNLAKDSENSAPPICVYCNEEFTSMTLLESHKCRLEEEILQHEKSRNSSAKLEYEVIRNQDGTERYKCLHCQFVYSNRSSLNKHHGKVKRKILEKELENSSDLKCPYCDEKFTNTSTLEAHKCKFKAFTSNRNLKCVKVGDSYKCLHCNEFYTSVANVRKHQERIVESLAKKKGKSSENVLVTNLKEDGDGFKYTICQDENGRMSYKCKHCENFYSRMTSLRKHHIKVKRRMLGLPIDPSRDTSGIRRLLTQKSSVKKDEKEEKDISNLKCSDCDENFDNLTAAKDHSKQNDHLLCTQCPVCRQIFARKSSILMHAMNLHFKNPESEETAESMKEDVSGQCLLCKRIIESEEQLLEHLKLHRNDYSVICDSCPLRFNNMESKVRHVMNSHYAPPSVFACTKCRQKFKYMFVLDAHDCSKSFNENMKIIDDRINDQFVCYVCKKNYGDNRKGYMVHLFTHNTVSLYKCHVCNKKFKQKNSLRKHLICSHAANKKYICHTCGKQFTYSYTLASHVKTQHLGIISDYQCPVCGKMLSCRNSLEYHIRTHSSTHKFMCDVCGKGFHQKGNMLKHKQVHSENRPYECDRCDATFRLEDTWKLHMKSHLIKEGAGPGKTKYGKILKCSYCGKVFPGHQPLTTHLRTHTNERPYPCTMCEKAFKEKSKLRRHMKTHKEVGDPYLQLYRPSFSALF